RARGGRARLDRLRSQSVELQIVEGGSVIEARYKCVKTPAYRIDVYDAKKLVFREGLDAAGPWVWPSSQPAPRQGVPDGRRTAMQGITFNLYGLHAFPALGNPLTLAGRELHGGVNYHVVRVAMTDGYETYLFIDPETWLIGRRRDVRAFHPDVNDTKKHLETQYGDYRPVDGLQFPFIEHQVDLATGAITQVTVVRSAAYDTAFDAAIFRRTYEPNTPSPAPSP
ncbi:MAG TPA: hypothetical protein VGC96_06905, partial [Candidatus Elarobacter sp.]